MQYEILFDEKRITAFDMILASFPCTSEAEMIISSARLISAFLYDRDAREYVNRDLALSYLLNRPIEELIDLTVETTRQANINTMIKELRG